MMNDKEVREKAAQLVAEHGAGAAQQAILSAETLLAAGQFYIDQWAYWRRIDTAIGEILAENGAAIARSASTMIGKNAE